MLTANLYLDRIDLAKYLTAEECRGTVDETPAQLAAWLRERRLRPQDCPGLSPQKRDALSLALRAAQIMPQAPSLELPLFLGEAGKPPVV